MATAKQGPKSNKIKVEPSDVAQTVIPNEVDGPADTVTLTSPWGTKVTVAAEDADALDGFTK